MANPTKKTKPAGKKAPAKPAGADKPIEEPSRLEALERDNRILSDAVDSLRDLTTDQGLKLSELTARLEKLEAAPRTVEPPEPAPPTVCGNGAIDPPGPDWGA